MNNFKEYKSKNGNLKIEISQDKLSAYLTILESDSFIDENEIVEFIDNLGIKAGLENAITENKEKTKNIGERFLIAKCETANNSSKINYFFEPENCIVVEDKLDLANVNNFESFIKNQELAILDKNDKKGVDKNIFGEKIQNSNKINSNNFLGENVYFSSENNSIKAKKTGYVYLNKEGKLNIKNDIYIKKNISKKHLKLFGNITINGVVNDSHLEVIGKLVVNEKIQDCSGKGIIVDGDVEVAHAEKSKIISSGKMTIYGTLENCITQVDGEIVGSKKSTVCGGLLQSGESIKLANVGNSFPKLTELEITYSPFKKLQLHNLSKELNYNKFTTLKKEFRNNFDIFLNKNIEEFQIRVENIIHKNSFFRILNHSQIVMQKIHNSQLSVKDGKLEINAIDRI